MSTARCYSRYWGFTERRGTWRPLAGCAGMTMALAALASTMRAYSGCTLLSRPMTSCMRLMFTKEARP